MVHQVRYSGWVALGWIGVYLMLWVVLSMVPVLGLLLEKSPWGWAALGGALLGWVMSSRRYWMRLFDNAPQIELHPTFLRAKQLDEDILWKQVQDIRGSQVGVGWDPGSKLLYLHLVGGKCVELDLAGLNTGMEQLHRLACAAWQADTERRRAGQTFDTAQEAVPPPAPVRTRGLGAAELGPEVERFGHGAGSLASLLGGAGFILGLPGFALWLDPSVQTPTPLIMAGMGSAFGIPLILRGVKILRARLVLGQKGLVYVGLWRRYTVRYGDILRTSFLSLRRVGSRQSTPVAVELILRDGRVVKLSDLKDVGAAGQRIEALRGTVTRDEPARGAEPTAAAEGPRG